MPRLGQFREIEQSPNAVNKVKINDKDYSTIIGVQKVFVGTKDEKRSITNPDIVEEKSEVKEVFNRQNTPKACWFILDLETGNNIKRYFPGSEVHAKTAVDNVIILAEASIESPDAIAYEEVRPIIEHAGTEIKIYEECILDPMDGLIKIDWEKMSQQTPAKSGWYKIWYNNITGYVHMSELTEIGYYEPF